MVVVVGHVIKVEDTQPDEEGRSSVRSQGESQQSILDRFRQLELRHDLRLPCADGGSLIEEVTAHALGAKGCFIAVVIFINVIYSANSILHWVFEIAHKRVFFQKIYFVILVGIVHLRNKNLNFDIILNEACLMRNKEVGVEYCDIDDELA